MNKPDWQTIAARLAKALRQQSNWTEPDDEKNCWCGGSKHIESVACLNARRALKAYRTALGKGEQS